MISCDATDCKFVWFHYTCVNLPYDYEPGDEEWLCPDCKKENLNDKENLIVIVRLLIQIN